MPEFLNFILIVLAVLAIIGAVLGFILYATSDEEQNYNGETVADWSDGGHMLHKMEKLERRYGKR